jgi:RNA polymerase sigma-70 factor, ECF subfamily
VGRADAEDLVQLTFQVAALNWEYCLSQLAEESRRKWLYRVLRNKAIDRWRADEHIRLLPEVAEAPVAADQDTSRQALSRIALRKCWAAIRHMPPVRQRVAFLRWGEDWKPKEIAALLGVSQDTVRAHLKRARDELVVQIGPEVPFIDADAAEEVTER